MFVEALKPMTSLSLQPLCPFPQPINHLLTPLILTLKILTGEIVQFFVGDKMQVLQIGQLLKGNYNPLWIIHPRWRKL